MEKLIAAYAHDWHFGLVVPLYATGAEMSVYASMQLCYSNVLMRI